MFLTHAALLALISSCSPLPSEHHAVFASIVMNESSGFVYAINVGGQGFIARSQDDLSEFNERYTNAVDGGLSFDVGLAQVNNQHHAKLFGSDPMQALDPCSNIRAGGIVFKEFYDRCERMRLGSCLARTTSAYNTGSFHFARGGGHYALRISSQGSPATLHGPRRLTLRSVAPQESSMLSRRSSATEFVTVRGVE